MSELNPEEQAAAIKAALAAGEKIQAIKLYREQTGVGLAEAKAAVEALEAGLHPGGPTSPAISGDAADAVQAALFAGEKIQAIKLYREQTKVGLAEAKAAVETLQAELWRTTPGRFTKPPRPVGKGCSTQALAAVELAVVAGAIIVAALRHWSVI